MVSNKVVLCKDRNVAEKWDVKFTTQAFILSFHWEEETPEVWIKSNFVNEWQSKYVWH